MIAQAADLDGDRRRSAGRKERHRRPAQAQVRTDPSRASSPHHARRVVRRRREREYLAARNCRALDGGRNRDIRSSFGFPMQTQAGTQGQNGNSYGPLVQRRLLHR